MVYQSEQADMPGRGEMLLVHVAYFLIAIAAIDRTPLSRLEGHFAVLAARCAYCGMHLTIITAAVSGRGPGSPACVPAIEAALGLVGVAPLSEKFLLTCAEDEDSATFHARNLFVLVPLHLDGLLNRLAVFRKAILGTTR